MSHKFCYNSSANELTPNLHKKLDSLQSFSWSIFLSFFLFQIYRVNFVSFPKLLRLLVQIPFTGIVRIIKRLLRRNLEMAPYTFQKDPIESSTTQIYFSRSKLTGIDLCMKLWPKRQVSDGTQEDANDQLKNLLEGLSFNRHFAPGIYLGIAPVGPEEKAKKILRGNLIINPMLEKLKPGKYAIVMRNIAEEWKLDYILRMKGSDLRSRKGMEFLAAQIADMHKQLELSPEEKAHLSIINTKLTYNINRLGEAIHLPGNESMMEKYQYIKQVINNVNCNFSSYFEQRQCNKHIKRCHGDLKASNLWVSPRKILPRKLFAFDCIDFKSDFCHIDTLSDIAMLAVDIQQVLSGTGMEDEEVTNLRQHFLALYLKNMEETNACTQSLLQYYMAEKAIVCSYVSFLLDDNPDLGNRYFTIAYQLAQDLEKLSIPIDSCTSSLELIQL